MYVCMCIISERAIVESRVRCLTVEYVYTGAQVQIDESAARVYVLAFIHPPRCDSLFAFGLCDGKRRAGFVNALKIC